MSVERFPLYNLFNIPEALRKLANDIEDGTPNTEHCVIVMMNEDGSCDYKAFGKDFTNCQAVGLLEFGKAMIMGLGK